MRKSLWISASAMGIVVAATVALLLRANGPTSREDNGAEPGVSYMHNIDPTVPWSINVVKVDRSRKDLTFFAPLARNQILGVSRLSDQARSIPPILGHAVAGVNGDFYERDNPTYAGDPRGLQIVNGELVSAPDTVCIWFDSESNPHLEDVKGDLKVTWPDGKSTRIGLNRQRLPNMAVLYTPTYGPSTRINGGRDLILENSASSPSPLNGERAGVRGETGDAATPTPWLPLRANQTYHARIREVRPSTNTPIPTNAMLLSIGSGMAARTPEVEAGTLVEISTALIPDLKDVKTAIGGGPVLIKGGKPFSGERELGGPPRAGYRESSQYERHPRSAVGWSATHFYFVTVDGRQPGFSIGMSLAELADYLVKLGCTEGMNFDGGASATMWMGGRVVNNPCQGERPIANSLLVVRKAKGN